MAEMTSPGTSATEIDQSGGTPTPPTGVPAGVIGTANRGPAFVPVTFGSWSSFKAIFGSSDGKKFGPLAVNEWMLNANAGAYIRVLGAGDGKKRSTSTGKVTNAGFTVGAEQVQVNGLIGPNPYATSGGPPGNVHFLATMMSQSAGSTILSEAGLQASSSAAVILRGVLMAPSGVVLMLSGTNVGRGNPSTGSQPALLATTSGPSGSMTGSLNLWQGSSEFCMLLNGHIPTSTYPNFITASLNPIEDGYISKQFNMDPSKIQQAGHLLYAHYDISETLCVPTGSDRLMASASFKDADRGLHLEDIVFLATGSANLGTGAASRPEYKGFENRFTTSKSPWIINQAGINLFRLHALDDGQIRSIGQSTAPNMPAANDRYKLSIKNIEKSTSAVDKFGTFTLVVRNFYDTDQDQDIKESYPGISLDPSSPNYLSARIGDMSTFFDFDKVDDEQRIVVEGSYPNVSTRIRIELSAELAAGDTSDDSLPIGFRGPDHLLLSGTNCLAPAGNVVAVYTGLPADLAGSPMGMMNEPPVPFRQNLISNHSGTISTAPDANLYWGIQFESPLSITGPNINTTPNPTLAAMTSFFPNFRSDSLNVSTGSNTGEARNSGGILDADLFNNNKFSLLNIQIVTGSNAGAVNIGESSVIQWKYIRKGTITPNEVNKTRALSVTTDFIPSMVQYLKFSFFLEGGFNGLDLFNKDKADMNNAAVRREMDDPTEAQKSSSTVAAYLKALDIMGRTSDVDLQILAIPGIRHAAVTDEAINTVENRFDALYIMDIEERDVLNTVITSSAQAENLHIQNTATAFANRALDTSFAAAYFPDVNITDPDIGSIVTVPPSVGVLGAISRNDFMSHPWFAPAGLNRGNIPSAISVAVQINQENQDRLYETDINPIRNFGKVGEPSSVIVFGQKTLQQAQSALDRINVRRLLIDVRRQVRNIANRFLFEPNREATLAAFSAAVQPVLQNIQQQQGVDRYKVIIDTTTTTQADVENNTIRGKIFLQPTRSIEFVSLDFVVANAGAEE
jgi:hypothetical protein